MVFKPLVFVLIVVGCVRVKSECATGSKECFDLNAISTSVGDIGANNDENRTLDESASVENQIVNIPDEYEYLNETAGYLSELIATVESGLRDIWSQISNYFKDDIEQHLQTGHASEPFDSVNNITEVYSKALLLSDRGNPLRSVINLKINLTNTPHNFTKSSANEITIEKHYDGTMKEAQRKEFNNIAFEENSKNPKISSIALNNDVPDNINRTQAEIIMYDFNSMKSISRSNNKTTIDTKAYTSNYNDTRNPVNDLTNDLKTMPVKIKSAATPPTELNTYITNHISYPQLLPVVDTESISLKLINVPDNIGTVTQNRINLPTTKLFNSLNNLTEIDNYSKDIKHNDTKPTTINILTTAKHTKETTELPHYLQFVSKKPDLNHVENISDNEIIDVDFPLNVDYDIEDDNTTDYPIIDYIELYKDTTNEYGEVSYTTEDYGTIQVNSENNNSIDDKNESEEGLRPENAQQLQNNSTIYPWIAAIFIKSKDIGQFSYYCDGAILSETVILTAARCVNISSPIDVEDFIIILGKRSLQSNGAGETVHKVKEIRIHENFTSVNFTRNDLAVLSLETPAVFSDTIQPAALGCDSVDNDHIGSTTAWDIFGELKTIYFEKNQQHLNCPNDRADETFCATFGSDVALCPNHGGVYAVKPKLGRWCLQGLRTADPTERGICVEKTVVYTALDSYTDWIEENEFILS